MLTSAEKAGAEDDVGVLSRLVFVKNRKPSTYRAKVQPKLLGNTLLLLLGTTRQHFGPLKEFLRKSFSYKKVLIVVENSCCQPQHPRYELQRKGAVCLPQLFTDYLKSL